MDTRTLLVVEDEMELRELIAEYFRLLGHQVLEADGGLEALQIFQQQHVDLLITDFRMARGNGRELIESIRAQSATHPHVVLVTGYADQNIGDLRRHANLTIVDKPFRFSELQSIVENALRTSVPQH